MIVSGERRDPFEVIDIYNHKILANQSKAALRRALRNRRLESTDIAIFTKLSKLLEAAYVGDQTVSSSQIKASSKYSLKILSQTLKAMEGILRDTEAFRDRLDYLHKSATELSKGNSISEERLNSLYDFCKRYAELQRQLLKQPSMKPSYGVTVWPFASQTRRT